jgi:hypothetical protein
MRKIKRTIRNKRYQRGGRLGSIPNSAIVSVRQDDFSAPMLVDVDRAVDMFEAREEGY